MTDHRETPGAPSAPDDHYQPWLRNRAATPSPAEEAVLRPPPLPTRQGTQQPATPDAAPRMHDISADELLARPVFLPQPAPPAPGISERLRAALAAVAEAGTDPEGLLDTLTAEGDPALFLLGEVYGTRASTLVAISADGDVHMVERRYEAGGRPAGTTALDFRIG